MTDERTGAQWFSDRVAEAKRDFEHLARRHGWGLCGRFPSEALEAE